MIFCLFLDNFWVFLTLLNCFNSASFRIQVISFNFVWSDDSETLEVGEQGEVVRWNNCSGTYKAADAMCFQTGLPLDKFWALVPGGPPGAAEPGRHWVSAGGVVMRRVLRR